MAPFSFAVFWRMCAVAGGYWLGAWLGVHYTIAPGGIAVLWPPNAVLLAAFLLCPPRQWPWLALAAMAAEVAADLPAYPLWAAIGFGMVNVFEATLAASLIRYLCREPFTFTRLHEGRIFLLSGPLLASSSAAVFGAAIYWLLGRTDGGYIGAWWTWWLGDALGLVVLTPVIVTAARWIEQHCWPRPSLPQLSEFSFLALLITVTGLLPFIQNEPNSLAFYFVPILLIALGVWAALRFVVLAAALIAMLICLLAVSHLVTGNLPYPQLGPVKAVWLTQQYLSIVTVVALGLSMFMREIRQQRERLLIQDRELHAHNLQLEKEVEERTRELRHANEELHKTNQRLERIATTDSLTGLATRRHFEELAQRQLKRVAADGQSASLIMFDVDVFKCINDYYGHDVGDEVLRRIFGPVSAAVRPHDLCGRWGGEEFVLLLTPTDASEASRVAERIRAGIESMEIEYHSEVIGVTASFGVAEWNGREGLHGLTKRADAALYRAKRLGKNRVEMA